MNDATLLPYCAAGERKGQPVKSMSPVVEQEIARRVEAMFALADPIERRLAQFMFTFEALEDEPQQPSGIL